MPRFAWAFCCLLALSLVASHSEGPLFGPCGGDPYYRGKTGFPDVGRAKDHAFREFKAEVRRGLDPSRQEFFCYLYTLDLGGRTLFFHSPWQRAVFEGIEHGSQRHRVQSPLAETEVLRIHSLMHSHPTAHPGGEGPSRLDVATASRYRNPDGSFRYLYLINNQGRLIQFRARRHIDPASASALKGMPIKPRVGVDWID